MNIVFANANRKWGGVKTWTLDFGRELQRRGHQIITVVRSETPFVAACRDAGFRVYPFRFGGKYDPLAILRLVRILRKERAQVVVVNISKDVEVGGVAARLCGVPVLHRVGLVEDFRGTFEERWRHRLLVAQVLVPAHWMRDELVARFPWLGAARVTAIPNSKHVRKYTASSGSGTPCPVFAVTSQLSPSKGHRYLISALGRLQAQGVPLHLRVAGTGWLERELRDQAVACGVAERISWEGFRDDMSAFLAEQDGFVLPSLKEGFPNSLLEALCAGLPTIASDLPGVREMVGETGLLVRPGEAEPLADALEQLAENAALRRQLGAAARQRALQQFDVARNGATLEELLQHMVASGSGR